MHRRIAQKQQLQLACARVREGGPRFFISQSLIPDVDLLHVQLLVDNWLHIAEAFGV